MRKFRSNRGITLVELVTIVVIIGIVAALAGPRFSTTISRLKFRTSARDIVSKMRLARSNAVTHKQPFGVYFDNTVKSVTLFLDSNNPGASAFESTDSVLSVDTLPNGFAYVGTDFGQPSIIYRPNGSATQTGHVYFMSYDENDGVNIGTIDVLSSTGRTKIQSLNYY